ncbi:MFS transporter [Epidermidibacterium keratini]
MEWFDWNIYATFAPFFASQFFNSKDPVSDVLSTLAVFAVGFLARPFGGLLFGWIADKKGRKLSMSLTIGVAAVGSLVIGLSPTYTQIGVGASLILLVARLGQGLAHGGELPSAQTYIAETAPNAKRGLWSSLIYFSGTCGIIIGTLMGAVLATVLTEEQMTSFGWRIPFIIGGLFGLYALFMRRRMYETETFVEETTLDEKLESAGGHHESIWQTIKAHPKLLFQVIGMVAGATVIYYVWAVSAPQYAINVRGIDPEGALWAGVGANLIFLIVLPIWGIISDRIGRKPVMLIALLGLAVLYFPLNAMIGTSAFSLFIAISIALIFMGGFSSIGPAVFAEIFPTRIRAVGLGVPYSISVALFGGTAPYLQTFFADRGMSATFQWYAIALGVISAIVVLTLPETKGIDLAHESVGAHGRRKVRA